MVEAMVALTLVDAIMSQQAQCSLFETTLPLEARPNPMGSTVQGRGSPGLVGTKEEHSVAAASNNVVGQRIDEE